jgi:hypothetical protein
MLKFQMDVSKKDPKTNKYVKQGEVAVTTPLLADVIPFMGAAITSEEEGVPVYDAPEANWLMSAILSYVKATARNKLISGTANLKDGLKIPETWAEFTAEGIRGGGAALLAYQEAKRSFAEWITKQGKTENVQNTLITLFGNKAALSLQSTKNKEKMKAYVEEFASALEEDVLERLQRPIESVIEACSTEEAEL